MNSLFSLQAQYIEHGIIVVLAIFSMVQLISANNKAKAHAEEIHGKQAENMKQRSSLKKLHRDYLQIKETLDFTEKKLAKTEKRLVKLTEPKVVLHKASNPNSLVGEWEARSMK